MLDNYKDCAILYIIKIIISVSQNVKPKKYIYSCNCLCILGM